jgi:type II restriction enzyme
MVRYDLMGFASEAEYLNYFFKTLLKTNWTYDYFVEWQKVKENVAQYVKEISLLNAISKVPSENRKQELKTIFFKYPETIPVIPLIIAMREQNIEIFEFGQKTFKCFNFAQRKISENEVVDLVEFCDKVGIVSLFAEINDLYAYLLGVEVGLDSNARKNRSGKIFQQLLKLLLKEKMAKMNLEFKAEDKTIESARNKRADFVIYKSGKPKIAIECNFYSNTGSKPIETANAYIDLQRKIKEKGICSFIWITDGLGWRKMQATVNQCFREIDFPINYTIATERLETIISKILNQ